VILPTSIIWRYRLDPVVGEEEELEERKFVVTRPPSGGRLCDRPAVKRKRMICGCWSRR
jgi:hypothetical protein